MKRLATLSVAEAMKTNVSEQELTLIISEVRGGTDTAKENAAGALWSLAVNTDN